MATKRPYKKSAGETSQIFLSIEGNEVLELYSEYFSTDSEVLKRLLKKNTFADILPEDSDYLDKYDPTSLRAHLLSMKRFQETPEQRQIKAAEEFIKLFQNNKTVAVEIDEKKKEILVVRMLGLKANKAKETFGIEKGEVLTDYNGLGFENILKCFVALKAREVMNATTVSHNKIEEKGASLDMSPAYVSSFGWCNVDVRLHIPFEIINTEGLYDWIIDIMGSIPMGI